MEKGILTQFLNEKLIQNLKEWDMDYLRKENCSEEDLFLSRLINIAEYYFTNVNATYEELKNKFVYEEALILLDVTNGIGLNPQANGRFLIDDIGFVKENGLLIVEEKYYDSLINKLKNLTEMQIHAVCKMCKNYWYRKGDGTFTKEEVERGFNIAN